MSPFKKKMVTNYTYYYRSCFFKKLNFLYLEDNFSTGSQVAL